MRALTASSFSTLPSTSAKTQIGTPQARWRDKTQSGRPSIMARRRFWPAAGTKRVSSMADSARDAQRRAVAEVLVHIDEPLRRVAEDDRLLGAPGMRIFMLEAATGKQIAGGDQRLDDALVGVALLAVVVDARGQAPPSADGPKPGASSV